jgi:hypothetical protein
MWLILLAITVPVLFRQEGPDTAPDLRKSGITHIAVPAASIASWRNIADFEVEPADIAGCVNLPTPGVALRPDEASASHIPWITLNGWRFLREPRARVYYQVDARSAPLAAAEAFSFSGQALIRTDMNGVKALANMLHFLNGIDSDRTTPIADVAIIDDGSSASAEVMNLMVRDNLLFEIVRFPGPGYKLTVQLGSRPYSRPMLKDADGIVHKIRSDLTDARRTVRLFGTSVVVAHMTGDPEKPRLHLLNYGAPADVEVGGFRVRVLGRYPKSEIHSFDDPAENLMDYEMDSEATEFTVPDLKTYAVVDLAR